MKKFRKDQFVIITKDNINYLSIIMNRLKFRIHETYGDMYSVDFNAFNKYIRRVGPIKFYLENQQFDTDVDDLEKVFKDPNFVSLCELSELYKPRRI